MYGQEAAARLRVRHPAIFGEITVARTPQQHAVRSTLGAEIVGRIDLIHSMVRRTVEANADELENAVTQFSRWMDDRAIVRGSRCRAGSACPT